MQNKEIENSFLKLHQYLVNNKYRGYELDDILGSPIVRLFSLNNLLLKRIAIQVGERLPLNVRHFLGIKKLESTKARGFFSKGYLYYYLYSQDKAWLDLTAESLEWLLKNQSGGFSGISWGNAFDFASRGGFFPEELPTIVWTSHVAEAFEEAYLVTKNNSYLDALKKAGDFILSSLERHEDEKGICFAYAPGRLNLVHNSNLLAAATLLKCWKYYKLPIYYELAKLAYEWTISNINPDGSWYYGVGRKYRWVDNHHTAYNIDCLIKGNEIGGEDVVPYSVIKESYDYWVSNFFLNDEIPKFYNNRPFPVDIQCAAQAIETLSKQINYFPEGIVLAERVLSWTIKNMQKKNGAFRYQIRRFWKNNLEPIHWGQSTMLSAISTFLYFSSVIASP